MCASTIMVDLIEHEDAARPALARSREVKKLKAEEKTGLPGSHFIPTLIYCDAFLDILHDSFLHVAQS